MVNVGDQAPDFVMPIETGKEISLRSFSGKKLVLYFYPKDDTPGCTLEAKDFADNMANFEALNTVIIGVSKDSLASHEKFKTKYCLPFSLASDSDGKACDAYGVWVEKSMYGKKYMGIDRATFVIDEQGIVRNVWRKVSVTDHVKAVLEAVKKIS